MSVESVLRNIWLGQLLGQGKSFRDVWKCVVMERSSPVRTRGGKEVCIRKSQSSATLKEGVGREAPDYSLVTSGCVSLSLSPSFTNTLSALPLRSQSTRLAIYIGHGITFSPMGTTIQVETSQVISFVHYQLHSFKSAIFRRVGCYQSVRYRGWRSGMTFTTLIPQWGHYHRHVRGEMKKT